MRNQTYFVLIFSKEKIKAIKHLMSEFQYKIGFSLFLSFFLFFIHIILMAVCWSLGMSVSVVCTNLYKLAYFIHHTNTKQNTNNVKRNDEDIGLWIV